VIVVVLVQVHVAEHPFIEPVKALLISKVMVFVPVVLYVTLALALVLVAGGAPEPKIQE